MARLKAPQRRQQLIDVATKLFARNGYDATTTAAIALAANVTEPILYRHFKSKQELFVAIVKEVSNRTIQHWQQLMEGITDPAEQIRVVAREFPQHISQLGEAYHVLHGALATSRDKKVLAVIKEHYAQIERFFTRIVQDGQKNGIFRKNIQPKMAAWQITFTGIGYAMINLNLMQLDRPIVDDSIESILRGWSLIRSPLVG